MKPTRRAKNRKSKGLGEGKTSKPGGGTRVRGTKIIIFHKQNAPLGKATVGSKHAQAGSCYIGEKGQVVMKNCPR